MNTVLTSVLLVLAAYLIGAIPFGYLTAKWLKGIDIRTVGSGNIGATNVGRVLGFRYFLLVFAFDLAKGFLPTWAFPLLASKLTGLAAPPDLAVLVALATIMGHNFPVYLRFKGGKGVATSLGAMFALDPVASLAAAAGFSVLLLLIRYVSLSSIGGGMVFFVVHFLRVPDPWSREERAMSILTVSLLVLLIARHRKNFARVAAGTEPKVSLRRKKDERRSGKISVRWLLLLAASAALVLAFNPLWKRLNRRDVLSVGRHTIAEVARVGTGHQRAERVAFAAGGKLLAVTCPRYQRLVIYKVTDADDLELINDLALDGKPVAVCPAGDRFFVLQRPPGDHRHVEPGWWQAYDLQGEPRGDKVLVGYYPDDMVLSLDGRYAFVLTSGHAEGDAKKPAPALESYDLASGGKPVGRVTFEGLHDDPSRLTLSSAGQAAAVTLLGSNVAASVDLFDPTSPRLINRAPLSLVDIPYPSHTHDDSIVMPVASSREALVLSLDGAGECVLSTMPEHSGLELFRIESRNSLGRLTLRGGSLGLGATRPIGLAFSPERNLIAVAGRSGSVHLVAIRTSAELVAVQSPR